MLLIICTFARSNLKVIHDRKNLSMKKCGVFFYIVPVVFAAVVVSTITSKPTINFDDYVMVDQNTVATVELPVEVVSVEQECFKYPILSKSFTAFFKIELLL